MIWLSLCTKFHLSTLTINQQSCFVQSSSVTQVELKKFVLIEFVYLEILFIAKIVIFTWYFKGKIGQLKPKTARQFLHLSFYKLTLI